ncbi:MAG: HAMP domain-containing histidine kinase, partial [Chloroflexota bacterium]|nr:HAMP domain-containing histidine kinase [Chloroflexota bacterium]
LSRVDAEVSHLETLVRDLLTLARSETAQGGTKRERCEVDPLIRQIVEPWLAPLAERAVDLNVSVSPGLVGRLDWTRVRHLLSNLIENAARHTPSSGCIEVTASQRGGDLEITVFNTGSGIAPDDLPHLFLPFYRGKGSDSESGTGLGLALCEWIARAHGGSIRAQNERDGVTFLIRLPRG